MDLKQLSKKVKQEVAKKFEEKKEKDWVETYSKVILAADTTFKASS